MIKSNKITKLNANPVGAGLVPAQNSEGITLVALIITIIIMLILLGVTVNIAINGGLFGMTKEAVKKTEIAAYKEKIDAIRINIILEQISNWLTSKEFMDRYEEELRKDKNFEGSEITRDNDETIILITKEGYKFIITEEGTNYEGDTNAPETPETPKEPTLTKNDITYDKKTWTQGPVKVSINKQIEGYTLKYKTAKADGTIIEDWRYYTVPIEMTENGAIDIQLIDSETNTVVSTLTANVTNIDKKAPTITAPATSTAQGNKITLTFSDNAKDGNEIKWAVCTSNSSTDAKFENNTQSNSNDTWSGTFDISLDTDAGTYYIYAKDSAGNITDDKDAVQITITEANLKNETTGKYYNTLEEAFNDASERDILTLLNTYTDSSAPTLNTDVIIDIGSHTLTKDTKTITVASGGTLQLQGSGIITTSENMDLFTNYGTISTSVWAGTTFPALFTGVLSNTSSSDCFVLRNNENSRFESICTGTEETCTISGKKYAIRNAGYCKLMGVKVTSETSHTVWNVDELHCQSCEITVQESCSTSASAIVNNKNATVEIKSGTTITSHLGAAIYNSGELSIDNYNGIITSTKNNVVFNNNNDTSYKTTERPAVKIISGTLTSTAGDTAVTINNGGNSMIHVIGGTISNNGDNYVFYASDGIIRVEAGTKIICGDHTPSREVSPGKVDFVPQT